MDIRHSTDCTEPSANESAGAYAQPDMVAHGVEEFRSVRDTLRNPDEAADELQALRVLLFKKEIAAIDALENRLNDRHTRAEELSAVVAEALLLRSAHDDRLAMVLEPVIGSAFGSLIRKQPKELAAEIFPIMGSAIRRSIAETFHSMLLNFQQQIELSLSWKGLRWRLEALRTGKSFSEVVLLKTLVYRVDQVFFIHSRSGLVLSHLAHEGLEIQDADLVSAMLTAVQDFVRDCFSTSGNQDAELSSMNFGDGVILLEKHPYASLACLVRGTPPARFRDRMASVLDTLLVLHAQDLAEFSGDTAPFAAAEPYLEECFISRTIDEGKPLSGWVKVFPFVLLAVIALFFGENIIMPCRKNRPMPNGPRFCPKASRTCGRVPVLPWWRCVKALAHGRSIALRTCSRQRLKNTSPRRV